MGGQPRRRKLLCHNWVRKVPPQKSTHNKASGFSQLKNIEAEHIKHCAFFSHLYFVTKLFPNVRKHVQYHQGGPVFQNNVKLSKAFFFHFNDSARVIKQRANQAALKLIYEVKQRF